MVADSAVPEGPFPPEARAILESMGDAFYALDGAWRIAYANGRALAFWGLPAAEVVGRSIWERLPQLIGTDNEATLRRARAEQATIAFEAPSPVTGVWVSVTVGPWAGGVTVYWRDITERKAAEQALRDRAEHLRLAQEAGGIGTWEWDLRDGRMQWSAQMFRVLGLEPGGRDDLPAALLAAVHPQDRGRARSAFAAYAAQPGPLRVELRVVHPDGQSRWIVFLGQVEADGAGRPQRMLGVTIDGTERRQVEEAIRGDAKRLRLAMRAGGLAAWEFDLEREVRAWSPEAAAMLGLSPGTREMPRRDFARMIHPDDVPRVRASFSAALEGRAEYDEEYRVVRADGSVRWTAVQGTLLRDSDGRAVRLVGVVRDVTERKQTEARLLRLNDELEARVRREMADREAAQTRAAHAERMQALGQLAGGIAHDFNNVLQAVSGGASLMSRRPGEADSVRRFARIIQEAATRGSSITRRLLAFAHRGDLRAEPLDAAAVLEGLRELLVHTLGAGITVEVRCAPQLSPLFADRGQLETVLVNLATNARDAMPDGGRLTFAASAAAVPLETAHGYGLAPGGYVALAVTDTGSGMDVATLARAAEPFFTTKRTGEGTGLGLAMARGFAEQSGGALSIDSTAGMGTTVTLFLPVAEGTAEVALAAAAMAAEPVTVGQLLLVDDDALVRTTLAAQLEDAGYAVRAMADGADALAWIAAGGAVDCLIADLSMPGMDGLALIRDAQRHHPRLPAVLLTGYAGDGAALAVSGALSGAFSLLRKPVEVAQLCDRIALLLEGARETPAPG